MTEPEDPTVGPHIQISHASAKDIAEATAELDGLAEHWGERLEEFDATSGGKVLLRQRSLLGDAARRFSQNKLAMVSLAIFAVLVLFATVVPIFDHVNLEFTHPYNTYKGMSWHHPFGTDNQGKDQWREAWGGARLSLSIGFGVAFTILIVGLIYGSISGYAGGRLDNAMMRLLDSLYGLPSLPFSIIFIQIILARWPNASPILYMVPALSITAWFTAARIVRNQVLSLKENDFVESALSSGAKSSRIITRHLIPNIVGIMVVSIFLEIPGAILGEAVLSFLGLGVQSPARSWGTMLNNAAENGLQHTLLILVPGVLIAITIICSTAIADGLRDALDPRAEGH